MKENTGSVVMAVLSLGMAVLIVVITLVWWLSNAAFVVNVAHDMGVSGKMPDYIIYPSDTDAHLPFNESFIINTKLKDVKGRQVKPFDVSDKIGNNEPEQTVRVYYHTVIHGDVTESVIMKGCMRSWKESWKEIRKIEFWRQNTYNRGR